MEQKEKADQRIVEIILEGIRMVTGCSEDELIYEGAGRPNDKKAATVMYQHIAVEIGAIYLVHPPIWKDRLALSNGALHKRKQSFTDKRLMVTVKQQYMYLRNKVLAHVLKYQPDPHKSVREQVIHLLTEELKRLAGNSNAGH